MGSQRVRHNLATKQRQQHRLKCPIKLIIFLTWSDQCHFLIVYWFLSDQCFRENEIQFPLLLLLLSRFSCVRLCAITRLPCPWDSPGIAWPQYQGEVCFIFLHELFCVRSELSKSKDHNNDNLCKISPFKWNQNSTLEQTWLLSSRLYGHQRLRVSSGWQNKILKATWGEINNLEVEGYMKKYVGIFFHF